MSDSIKSLLCVGGPVAGRRYAIAGGNGFAVPVAEEISLDDRAHRRTKPTELRETRYRLESINTPDGRVEFWVPQRQTALETMAMLLATYELAAAGAERTEAATS